MLTKLLCLSALLGTAAAAPIYDSNKMDVTVYTKLNFDKQVTNQRDKGISLVHFYKASGK